MRTLDPSEQCLSYVDAFLESPKGHRDDAATQHKFASRACVRSQCSKGMRYRLIHRGPNRGRESRVGPRYMGSAGALEGKRTDDGTVQRLMQEEKQSCCGIRTNDRRVIH